MAIIKLSPCECERLREVVRTDRDANKVRRAVALLSLNDNERVAAVARRLGVGRVTLYYWIRQYEAGGGIESLPRSGRPSTKSEETKRLLRALLNKAPAEVGYPGYIWTAPLLRKYLRLDRGLEVSAGTIRQCLRDLGWSWQRPQLSLARESPTWRQAKGGSSGA